MTCGDGIPDKPTHVGDLRSLKRGTTGDEG
jgi:hypothetical protein